MTSTFSKSPPSTSIEIYPDGDLWLSVGPKSFRISSFALRISSPVFSRMLDPTSPFSEGRGIADGTLSALSLHEDDPDAMEIILNVIHHRGKNVPQDIPPEKLFDIGKLCDKYDLVAALKGWTGLWIGRIPVSESVKWKTAPPSSSSEGKKLQNEQQKQSVVKWLAIAWTFRDQKLFEEITRYLIPNSKYTSDGSLVDMNDTPLAIEGIPQKVIDMLSNAIDSLHATLSSTVSSHFQSYIKNNFPICNHKSVLCDRIQLGTLVRLMANAEMLSMPSLPLSNPPYHSPQITANQILEAFGANENPAVQLSPSGYSPPSSPSSPSSFFASRPRPPRPDLFAPTISFGSTPTKAPKVAHAECSRLPRIHEALVRVVESVKGLKIEDVDSGLK